MAKHPDEQNGNDLAYALYANTVRARWAAQWIRAHRDDYRSAAATEGALQGQWMQSAATTGGVAEMYVNGNARADGGCDWKCHGDDGPLWLGAIGLAGRVLHGVVDEVRILGVTLSRARSHAHAHAGLYRHGAARD